MIDGLALRPEAGAVGLELRFLFSARAEVGGTVSESAACSLTIRWFGHAKQVNQGKLRGRGKNLESLSTNVENPYG